MSLNVLKTLNLTVRDCGLSKPKHKAMGITSMPLTSDTAEVRFRDAFERLKSNRTQILPSGTVVTPNNVAKEAGRDPTALRKTRYPALVREIQTWVKLPARRKRYVANASPNGARRQTPRRLSQTSRSSVTMHSHNSSAPTKRFLS
jgi:hypothetical protein